MWGTVLLYSFLRVSVFTDNMLLTSPLSQPLVALKTIFVYIIPQEIDRPGSSEVVSCYNNKMIQNPSTREKCVFHGFFWKRNHSPPFLVLNDS